jgi:hypothetical protein
MREAIITRAWGEVIAPTGRKIEGWAWEVSFFNTGDQDPVDRHVYKTELAAQNAANLFERGLYFTSDFGGVEFEVC